eukprot:3066816-Alexandrium_andersonii.AAC.1
MQAQNRATSNTVSKHTQHARSVQGLHKRAHRTPGRMSAHRTAQAHARNERKCEHKGNEDTCAQQ